MTDHGICRHVSDSQFWTIDTRQRCSQKSSKLTSAGWVCAIAACVLSVLVAYQYAVWDLKYGDDGSEFKEKFEFLARYPLLAIPVAIDWIGIGVRHFAIDYRWVSAKEDRYFGARSRKALYYWGLGLLLIVASIWGL